MASASMLPKVELHVHLEGAIPHSALFDLIQQYGGDPSLTNVAELARRFEFKHFAQCIDVWSWKNRFLREYEDLKGKPGAFPPPDTRGGAAAHPYQGLGREGTCSEFSGIRYVSPFFVYP